MARKIIAVHGIGDTRPGWSSWLRLDLDIPEKDWIEFNYDDLMDRSLLNRLIIGATKIYLKKSEAPERELLATGAQEHLNDLISYFVMNGTRLEIQLRLKAILQTHPDAIILAHSLGSVVAYETMKNFDLKAHALFTLGSPLSKGLVKRFLRIPEKSRPNVSHWYNVWSPFDPISGQIKDLGCRSKDQFKVRNTHDLLGYVHSQRKRILALYDPINKEKAS